MTTAEAAPAVGEVRRFASGRLLVDEPAERVARVTISNPAKRGALDLEILDALCQVVREQEARCLVLTGEGDVFSAGYDIGNFPEPSFSDDSEAVSAFSDEAERLVAHPFNDAIEAIEAYPYPVLAAINGHAIGGGLELAVTCDLRMAARGARLGMPPAKIGLIYSHTGLRKFIELIGAGNTNELFCVGRDVTAERGYEMGLVNYLVDSAELADAAVGLAAEIAANSPLALSGNKEIVRTLVRSNLGLPEDVARRLVRLRESCFTSADFVEGIRAFGDKRRPRWEGR